MNYEGRVPRFSEGSLLGLMNRVGCNRTQVEGAWGVKSAAGAMPVNP